MLDFIDNFLNRVTMYRLVLYCLTFLVLASTVLSFFGMLPFSPASIVFTAVIFTAVCFVVNKIFEKVFEAPTNVESLYITALILTLIVSPIDFSNYSASLPIVLWSSIFAMASKFILAIGKKHIFNPAAFSVLLTAIVMGQYASWWVGSASMSIFVLLGGILIVRKIKRTDLVAGFFMGAFITVGVFGMINDQGLYQVWSGLVLNSPLLFFGFIMMTEPLTTPPSRWLRVSYGVLTGFLFAPPVHLFFAYSTPETALLAGNIFSYIVSPKKKLLLKIKEKIAVAENTFEFIFKPDSTFNFSPGQYMEWTIPHEKPDNRGNRRYFTIASSPTEAEIRFGTKFYENGSSFKKKLKEINEKDPIVASGLSGDFVMPKDKNKKLVFVAGGIGITPFRSMIKYLTDKNEKRDIVLVYSNKTASEIAYKKIFDDAEYKIGLKTVYTVTDQKEMPINWLGFTERLNAKMIASQIPDYSERIFYLSGPHSMVSGFRNTLIEMGVSRSKIKTDYFPGFA
ncbi:MAG: oxidoreductase [Candidatus Paceibacterota bacterium]